MDTVQKPSDSEYYATPAACRISSRYCFYRTGTFDQRVCSVSWSNEPFELCLPLMHAHTHPSTQTHVHTAVLEIVSVLQAHPMDQKQITFTLVTLFGFHSMVVWSYCSWKSHIRDHSISERKPSVWLSSNELQVLLFTYHHKYLRVWRRCFNWSVGIASTKILGLRIAVLLYSKY
jgi:hypothetical protein